MKQAEVITFTKSGEGFTTPSDTRQVIAETLTHRKDSHWQRISPKDARSAKSNRFYRGSILRLVAEYCASMGDYVITDEKGKRDYEPLHRYLMILYCVENNRPDLCDMVKTYVNREWITVPIASNKFAKMSHEDDVRYKSWIENKFRPHVGGLGFTEMLEREKMEVS
jgi:hypothetical protein